MKSFWYRGVDNMYSQCVEILKQAPNNQSVFKEWLETISHSNQILPCLFFIFLISLALALILMILCYIALQRYHSTDLNNKRSLLLGEVTFVILFIATTALALKSSNESFQYKNVESYISENTTIKGKHLYVLEDDKKTMEALKHERDVLLYDQNNHIINANAFPSKVSDKEYNHAVANGKDIDKLTLVGNKETALSSLINSKKLKEMSNILSVEEKGNKTIIYYVDKK